MKPREVNRGILCPRESLVFFFFNVVLSTSFVKDYLPRPYGLSDFRQRLQVSPAKRREILRPQASVVPSACLTQHKMLRNSIAEKDRFLFTRVEGEVFYISMES